MQSLAYNNVIEHKVLNTLPQILGHHILEIGGIGYNNTQCYMLNTISTPYHLLPTYQEIGPL